MALCAVIIGVFSPRFLYCFAFLHEKERGHYEKERGHYHRARIAVQRTRHSNY